MAPAASFAGRRAVRRRLARLGALAGFAALIVSVARPGGSRLRAQAATAPPATFAAVSIRPSPQRVPMSIQADPAGLRATSIALRQLIVYAYGLQDAQLNGGAEALHSHSWTQVKHFNLAATTDAPATDDQLRLMLRAALQDRFGLQLRREEKPTPLLALVVAPGGVKFKALQAGEAPQRTPPTPGLLTFRVQTITILVSRLNYWRMLGMPTTLKHTVVDHTGLTGNYDIRLTLPLQNAGGPRANSIGWSAIPSALKADGLELKPVTLPFATYTIESAHQPTAN